MWRAGGNATTILMTFFSQVRRYTLVAPFPVAVVAALARCLRAGNFAMSV